MTPSPTPPGDQVREAAVEAVAQLLSADYDSHRAWVKGDEAYRDSWREDAETLLSLPAVSALLAEARADELEQAADDPLMVGLSKSTPAWLRRRATHTRAAVRRTEGN